uniref:Uncharacterized protein n=3 Tax=Ixodes ricinus TaxID=34613 RepID=A0A131XUY5_IXORI
MPRKMRVTPWIDQFVRSKKAGSAETAQTEFGIALVKSVHPTYAVIGDTHTEIHAVFSDDVRELVRLTVGGDLSALEKRYVRVLTAEPCFVVVRGRRKEAIAVDQVVVLDQGKCEAAEASEPPENITFKSDARNLIKKVVTKMVTPEKRANRVDALLRDMKSRMGAALTTPPTATALKTGPLDVQHNGTEDPAKRAGAVGASVVGDTGADGPEVPSTSAIKKTLDSPENSATKRLRSTSRAARVSLRSGKCYANGEAVAEDPETLPPSPKRSRTSVSSQREPVAEPAPAATASTKPSTSATPKASAKPTESPKPTASAKPTALAKPSTRPTRPRGQSRAACHRPPLWDIAPPLLDAMRNLVHKHFSKWT